MWLHKRFRRSRQRELAYLDGKPFVVHLCLRVSQSVWLEATIIITILCNTVTLSLDHYGMSPTVTDQLAVANVVFSVVFCVELLVRVVGTGPAAFFRSYSSWFDALVVLSSIIEIALAGERPMIVF